MDIFRLISPDISVCLLSVVAAVVCFLYTGASDVIKHQPLSDEHADPENPPPAPWTLQPNNPELMQALSNLYAMAEAPHADATVAIDVMLLVRGVSGARTWFGIGLNVRVANGAR